MIFIVLIVLAIVVGAVVLRRAGVGMGGEDGQLDSVYEMLEDEPGTKVRGKLIEKMRWTRSVPMPDKTPGCFVILTFASKKDAKSSLASYEHAYVGRSSKDEAAMAARNLSGAGNEVIAEDVVRNKKPFALALLPCEEYGMDVEDCEAALRKVFNDERLVKSAPARRR